MMVRFQVARDVRQVPRRELVYRRNEYSFDMEPPPNRNFTSVLVDDLNIELDDTGRVVSVCGVCPYTRWKDATLRPPSAKVGAVSVNSDAPLARGVSVQVNQNKYLPTFFDRCSGWIKIEAKKEPALAIRVFSGVIFEMDEHGELCSLWLKPRTMSSQSL